MQPSQYRVSLGMIPPVVMAMGFGVVLLMMEGNSKRGFLMFVVLLPFFYLGLEILARKIILDEQGITVRKLLRSVRLEWTDIEALDAVRSGSKLFLMLQAEHVRPVLITNTISSFDELVRNLQEAIPKAKIAESAQELLVNPPPKRGPLVQAWAACLLLAGIALGRILGYG
jgi:hypothetical protein